MFTFPFFHVHHFTGTKKDRRKSPLLNEETFENMEIWKAKKKKYEPKKEDQKETMNEVANKMVINMIINGTSTSNQKQNGLCFML